MATALGIGWRQPKVSKIETGRQLPTVEEVAAWAATTQVDPTPLLALREKAAASYAAWKDRIAGSGGPLGLQDELAALESSSTLLVEYQPAMVPGLLQTPAYMRAIATANEFLTDSGIPPDKLGHVIAAKVRRQGILYEPGRRIVHVVGEAALRTRIGSMSIATLRNQLTQLAELASVPHHVFGVIPFSVPTPIASISGWELYDKDLVVVETLGGDLQITEPEAVARYSRWLEQLLDVALTGADAAAFCREVATTLVG